MTEELAINLLNHVKSLLVDAEYIEAVEMAQKALNIVHCKDCYRGQYDFMCDHYWCQGTIHTGDFFCAFGRRKVEG